MLKLFSKSWANKVLLLAFVVGLVSPSAQAYFSDYTGSQVSSTQGGYFSPYTGSKLTEVAVNEVAPAVTNLIVNPNPYNNSNGNASVSFDLNTVAKTTVDIIDNNSGASKGNIVKNLVFDQSMSGHQTFSWNGKNASNQVVNAGNYTAKVIAYNAVSTAVQTYNFIVTSATPAGVPDVTVSVNPGSFSPNANQTTQVTYTLNTAANLKVEVLTLSGAVIKTLKASAQTNAGVYNVTWNGTQNNGSVVAAGNYTVQVFASNIDGQDTAATNITVINNNNVVAPVISNVNASPSPFDPNTQSTTISFTTNTSADVTVQMIGDNNQILENIAAGVGSGTRSVTWNGAGASDNTSYTFKVMATNTAGSDTKFGVVMVDYINNNVGAPVVSNVVASPNPFNPNNQSTSITFTTDKNAEVTVQILDPNNQVFKSIAAGAGNGTRTVVWNGSGAADNTTYTIKVIATNASGSNNAFGSVTVNYNNNNLQVPVISNVFAQPTPFDSDATNTNINFTIDKQATVTVQILDGNTVVKTLSPNNDLKSAGTYSYSWNGKDSNGSQMSDGTYLAKVMAFNAAGNATSVTTTVVLDRDSNNGGGNCNLISSTNVNPYTFDPSDEDTLIFYNNNQSGNITIRIKDNGSTIRTLVNNSFYAAGGKFASWNGKDSNGDYVDNGTYTYEVRVDANNCFDIETGKVVVDNSSNDNGGSSSDWSSTDENLVSNVYVTNEIFDPRNSERSTVTYTLNDRSDVKVQVMDGNTIVKTLATQSNQSNGTYSYSWDGRNSNGSIVSDRVYQFRVMADSGSDTDTDRVYTEVDTDGVIIGIPSSDRCAGFKDVSTNSPFCKAIELMAKKNIFNGYSDGTFRPGIKINRFETTKVVVLALGYNVQSSYFGKLFRDTVPSWAAPYVYVAQENNIIDGYPDGYFRGEKTINKAELSKIFLEANQSDVSDCESPYTDVPTVWYTDWYRKYACYLKDNDIYTGSRFYGADAMNRGDVAQLFYQFETKGLYNVGNGNHNRYNIYDYNNNNDDYNYNSNNSNDDGYYVYQNGRYVWMPNY